MTRPRPAISASLTHETALHIGGFDSERARFCFSVTVDSPPDEEHNAFLVNCQGCPVPSPLLPVKFSWGHDPERPEERHAEAPPANCRDELSAVCMPEISCTSGAEDAISCALKMCQGRVGGGAAANGEGPTCGLNNVDSLLGRDTPECVEVFV
jgi:hypothetical protein